MTPDESAQQHCRNALQILALAERDGHVALTPAEVQAVRARLERCIQQLESVPA